MTKKFINRVLTVLAIYWILTSVMPFMYLGYKVMFYPENYVYANGTRYYNSDGLWIQKLGKQVVLLESHIHLAPITFGVLSIAILVILGLILLNTIIEYFDGTYDRWFQKNTDPFFEKMCNFINRKNGGCNES